MTGERIAILGIPLNAYTFKKSIVIVVINAALGMLLHLQLQRDPLIQQLVGQETLLISPRQSLRPKQRIIVLLHLLPRKR